MSKCPKCKKSPMNGTELICDNDCGTTFCEFCKFEWYTDQNRKLTTGHAPWCGDSDSDYIESSDESDNESSDQYESESTTTSSEHYQGQSVKSYLNERMDRIDSDNDSSDSESSNM